jgi:hypothetical protein
VFHALGVDSLDERRQGGRLALPYRPQPKNLQ